MAWEGPHTFKIPGLKAGGDLSADKFRFVKLSAVDTVVACTATTDVPVGVLQNSPTSGEEAEVVCLGVTKVKSQGVLAVGDAVGTHTNGNGVADNTAGSKNNHGTVLLSTTATSEIGTAMVNCVITTR